MKIKEIFNESLVQPEYSKDEPLQSIYDLTSLERERFKKNQESNKPTGWYSYGKEAKDPHEYNVQTHMPSRIEEDAKYIWVKAITNLMGDNPYIPIYYTVKLKPDKKGDSRVSYTMERLYDIDQIKNMHMSAIGDDTSENEIEANTHTSRLLISMIARVMGIDEAKKTKLTVPLTDPYRLWETFVYRLETSIGKTPIGWDPHMTEALDIVNNLRLKYGLTVDMHTGNVMLRNTNRGLVPVITDPLSDDGRSIIGKKY